jgi:hypothetical protein
MLDFLLRIPALIVSLVWSLFFPAQVQPVPVSPPPPRDPRGPDEESQREGHELSDADPATVGLWVIGLFVMIFSVIFLVGWMYTHLYSRASAMPVTRLEGTFLDAPYSKTSIAKDWNTIDALAHQRLDGYGWTDRAHGVLHVPIERAMALVARDGLPARAGQAPPFPPPDQEKLALPELETTEHATKFTPR